MRPYRFIFRILFHLHLSAVAALAANYTVYRYAGVTNTPATATSAHTIMVADSVPDKEPWAQVIMWQILGSPGLTQGYVETGLGWPMGGSYCRNSGTKKQIAAGIGKDDSTCIWYADEIVGHTFHVLDRIPLGMAVEITLVKNTNNTVAATWSYGGKVLKKTLGTGNWYSGPGISPSSVEFDTNTLYNQAFFKLPENAYPRNVHLSMTSLTVSPESAASLYSWTPAGYEVPTLVPMGNISGFRVDIE